MKFNCCRKKSWRIIPLAILIILAAGQAGATAEPEGFDASRARLLSHILRKNLTRLHYSHKQIDDHLSADAFTLYLKQLDGQKRFLLREDVARLQPYATRIDDEINEGKFELPQLGAGLLKERIGQVRAMVREVLAGPLELTAREQLETDPDKLDYCASLEELKDRWRKTIKLQVISRYLNLLEDEGQPLTLTPDQPAKPPAVPTAGDAAKGQPAALLAKAREKALKGYENFFTRMLEETPQDHFDRYLNAFARAFDPHTNYLPPDEKEDFDIHMRGSLEGIGALLQEEDGYIKVMRVIPGSAAARQGQLQAEDIILEVAEEGGEPVEITDTRIRDAVALIRGKKGTRVVLTVKKPDGARLKISIVRDVVQIEDTFVKSAPLKDDKLGATFGYLKVPSFYRDFTNGGSGRNATDDVRRELQQMAHSKTSGLIIDLRANGGGALEDAVSIAGLFIKSGPVVQIKDSDGHIEVLTDDDPKIEFAGPVVVLVSEMSASASEILAAALQDYGRAVVIGSAHTHGKGTVQTMVDLSSRMPFHFGEGGGPPLGALKVTTQKFYRISGESTQYRGVSSDIVMPDRLQYLKTGEQYAEFSLPWDTVEPTPFTRYNLPRAELERLKTGSEQRIAHAQVFTEISQEAKKAGERSEQSLQSITLDDVRQDFEQERLRRKTMSAAERSHLAGGDEDEEKAAAATAGLSREEKDNQWLKEISEDPYVREAEAILADMPRREVRESTAKTTDTKHFN